MRKKLMLLGMLLIFLLVFTGCLAGNQQNNKTSEQPNQTSKQEDVGADKSDNKEETPAEETVEFTVYFSDNEAMYLKGEKRKVAKNGKDIPELMIQELIKGPESKDLLPTIPEGTKLLSIEIKDNIAFVDFSQEIQLNHPGGSAGEIMTVYSIVNTLTQLPEIEAVLFLIEGEKEEAIWGHLETLEPIYPNPDLVK